MRQRELQVFRQERRRLGELEDKLETALWPDGDDVGSDDDISRSNGVTSSHSTFGGQGRGQRRSVVKRDSGAKVDVESNTQLSQVSIKKKKKKKKKKKNCQLLGRPTDRRRDAENHGWRALRHHQRGQSAPCPCPAGKRQIQGQDRAGRVLNTQRRRQIVACRCFGRYKPSVRQLTLVTIAIVFRSTIESSAATASFTRHLLQEEVSNEDPDKRIGKIPVAGPPGPTCRDLPQRSRSSRLHPHPRSAHCTPLTKFPTVTAARCWLNPSSDLGLRQRPGILQTPGEHRHAHHQNSAQADDHGHRHGAAVVQNTHQRRGTGGDAELQATEHRRSTAGPGALPVHRAGRGVGKDATEAGDADEQRNQQRPQLRRCAAH